MSQDTGLFQPPASYPQPPKGLHYEVPGPSSTTTGLKPIFPWETTAPRPTRVFAEDLLPISPPTSGPSLSGVDEETQADQLSPVTPMAQISSPDPWRNFSVTNAWDDIPEIEQYISNIMLSRRAKTETLLGDSSGNDVTSPGTRRRPSMKLTDFPTEIERPSLPVTPAPIRGPSFWGLERDEDGEFPAAAGVPKQEDWVSLEYIVALRSSKDMSFNAMCCHF